MANHFRCSPQTIHSDWVQMEKLSFIVGVNDIQQGIRAIFFCDFSSTLCIPFKRHLNGNTLSPKLCSNG